jgi:hypothetical protein
VLGGWALGDGVDEELAADEGILPGGAAVAKRLVLVARERGLLMPILNACTSAANCWASCSSSPAIET